MSKALKNAEIQNVPTGFYYIATQGNLLELLPDGSVFVPMSAAEQIESFAELEPGWDYGGGTPVGQPTIDAAQTWNRLLMMAGFETSASPGGEGEIAVSGSYGQYHLEVIVESDQSTSVAYDFRGIQEYYNLRRPSIEVLGSVLNAVGEIWSASTWSTPRNTTQWTTNGPELHFGTTAGPFQSLHQNASTSSGYLLANTYVNTGANTNTSVANRQFFGGSTPTAFLQGGQLSLMAPKANATLSSKD